MGRKSSIELLPDDIRAQLDALLLDPRMTHLQITRDINALLEDQGSDDRVTKSSVGRYAQTFKELTADVAETDRLAALMLKELNITNQSNVAQATAETLRVMLMHFIPLLKKAMNSPELSIKDLKIVTGMLKDLSHGHEILENAATINEKRWTEIRRKTREEAAEELTQELKSDGISPELEASIRRILIGQ